MLDGWYCRSIGNNAGAEEEEEEEEEEESQEEVINYKAHYRNLKRKLKFLIYENECFQEALRTSQRRLLKATRDRSFLLDRLLQYEKVDVTSSESEETESSDEGEPSRPDPKRRKMDQAVNNHGPTPQATSSVPKANSSAKKKRPPPKTPKQNNVPPVSLNKTTPHGDCVE